MDMLTDQHIMPVPDAISAPYWEAMGRCQVLVQWCTPCARAYWPATPFCPRCWGPLDWIPAADRGTVLSTTIVRRPIFVGVPHPYTLLVVGLDGPTEVTLVGMMRGACDVEIGDRVSPAVDLTSGSPLLAFEVIHA